MRILAWLLYWTVVTPAGMLNRILGRDPLLLRNASSAPSYWMPLAPSSGPLEYLSPADPANRPVGAARWLAVVFSLVARRHAGAELRVSEARSQDIPDEIYTLW